MPLPSKLVQACCSALILFASCQPAAEELQGPAPAKPVEGIQRVAAFYRALPHVDSLFAVAGTAVPPEDEAYVNTAENLLRDELLGVDLAPRTDWIGKSGCLSFSGCSFDDNPNSTVFRSDPAGKITQGSTYRLTCAKNSADDTDCDNFVVFPVPAARVEGYYATSDELNRALNFQTSDGALNLQELSDSTCAVALGSTTLFGLGGQGDKSPGLTIEQNFRVTLK